MVEKTSVQSFLLLVFRVSSVLLMQINPLPVGLGRSPSGVGRGLIWISYRIHGFVRNSCVLCLYLSYGTVCFPRAADAEFGGRDFLWYSPGTASCWICSRFHRGSLGFDRRGRVSHFGNEILNGSIGSSDNSLVRFLIPFRPFLFCVW